MKAKLPRPAAPTAVERARWRRIAADRSRVLVTDDAPDVSKPVPGLIECAPPTSFPIDQRTAAWFDAHGGTRAVLQALRAYMREHRAERHAQRESSKSGRRAARR